MTTTTTPQTRDTDRSAPRRRRRPPKAPAPARGIWPLLIPALIVTAALIVAPLTYSVILAFSASGTDTGLTLDGFRQLFTDQQFFSSVRITLFIFVAGLVLQIGLGLALGYLLSFDVPGRRIMQGAVLIPAITAAVAVALMWLLFFDPSIGTINTLLNAIGIDNVVWLGDPRIAPWALVLVDTWQWTPFVALIISAGIRSLPEDVFEAASIDGASGWRKAVHVGLPLLAPVLTVAILLRTVDLIRFFDLAYIMTDGGPINSTNTLNLYGYREAFINQNLEYAATLQVALIVFVLLVAGLLTYVRRKITIEY